MISQAAIQIEGSYCCWLKDVDSSITLQRLKVPQAHDAATGYMRYTDRKTWGLKKTRFVPGWIRRNVNRSETAFNWTQTQDLTIEELLVAGVRSFDLRIWVPETGEPHFHHGAMLIFQPFYATLQNMISFLEAHTSEFLYVLLIMSGPGDYMSVYSRYRDMCGDRFRTENNAARLTLGDVRGTMLTYSNHFDPEMISYYKTFETADCTGSRNRIVHDWEEMKMYYLKCFPRSEAKDQVFVTQLHTQVDVTTIKNSGDGGLQKHTLRFNKQLMPWLKNQAKRNMNIVEMDFYRPAYTKVFVDLNRL